MQQRCAANLVVDVSLPRSGTTSLLMAAKRGHAAVVALLLQNRADTEVAGLAFGQGPAALWRRPRPRTPSK